MAVPSAICGLCGGINAIKKQRSQKAATRIRTLLNVTTSLYRVPNVRTRSLSTLIVFSVNKETPQKIAPIVGTRTGRLKQSLEFYGDKGKVANRG